MKIGQYEYIYGAGSCSNRRITFYGNNTHVWGTVERKVNNTWESPEEIPEDKITLEQASTAEKVNIMINAREKNMSPIYLPDEPFEQIPYEKKVTVIKNLQPTGPYRISLVNAIGKNRYFETIEHVTFFDPS